MTRSTVLVLGANGRFGAAAVSAFSDAGWNVIAQVRREPVSALPANTIALNVALADTDALVAAAAGASVVVYAINPLYTDWDAKLLPMARQGMAVAQKLNATFMLPGNVYNYGDKMPETLTENTEQRPSNQKGLLRYQLEAEMRVQAAQGLRSAVIRAGDFFGAGSGSWFDQLIVKDVERGKLAYPGPMDIAHAWAYLPDLARAFVAVASQPQTEGFRQFNFAGHTLTGRELLRHVETAARELGLRPEKGFRIGGMPWGIIRVGGIVYPLWRELARMSYLWRVPHRLDGAALEKAVGPLPMTDASTAIRDAMLALGYGEFTRAERVAPRRGNTAS